MASAYTKLLSDFQKIYPGITPAFVVRVPGRVNLIGEHTDYNGLPVMPMAISREVRMVVAPRTDNLVQLHNTARTFGNRDFQLEAEIPSYETGDWGNYVKAGAQGIVAYAGEQGISPTSLCGFNAIIESDLPMAAGLSSSSAMVVAAALATMASNSLEMDRSVLAEHMAAAERYVGTMGGGMDQAVELLAQEGSAVKIDFFPVRTQPVILPADYSVVICNSMVVAPKTVTARLHYNRRPIECRLAAALLARGLDGRNGAPVNVQRVSELLPYVASAELLQFAQELFGGEAWTKEKAAAKLDMDITTLNQAFFRMRDGQILPEFADGLPLLARMLHVLTEGERVNASVIALEKGDAMAFGSLMNASHASCRDQYGISCPELEQLVDIAKEAGAIGARLTGAGFGGCTVSLAPTATIDSYRASLIERYYRGYLKSQRPDLYEVAQESGYDNLVIVSAPCQGAEVIAL